MKKQYPDYFMKYEKFKSKVKFKLKCNNLWKNKFIKQANGDYMFETTYTYRDIHMRCTLIIFKDKIDEIFSMEKIPNVRILGKREPFGIQFTIDASRRDSYMDMRYSQIPNIIKYNIQHSSKTGRCDITLEIPKKQYANIMNYYDKSLPTTAKRNKKQRTIYKCYNPRPYQGGGFSPK